MKHSKKNKSNETHDNKVKKHNEAKDSSESSSKHSSHSESSKSSSSMPGKNFMIASVTIMVVLLGVIVYLLTKQSSPTLDGGSYDGNKVNVEFYVMSQCPYGTQVEDQFIPVMKSMGSAIDWDVEYIVRETSPGVFQALHGEPEVVGNIAQLCAKAQDESKFVAFLECQNKDARNVDTNWQSCGASVGLDTGKLSTCISGEEGKTLLRASMQKANEKGASASPTMFVNGQAYNGGRTTADFQRAICQYVDHEACASIPKCSADADCTAEAGKEGTCNNPGLATASCTYTDPVKFEYVILNDDTCNSCDTTGIVSAVSQLFLGATPRTVDIDSSEGKALIAKHSIAVVPAYIFESEVTSTKSWNNVQGLSSAFDQLSDGSYKIKDEATGAAYYVSEEARAERLASIGVVKGDNKPQIDFFVMSYCPYGNQAEETIEPVYKLLGNSVEFKPRYVIYSQYAGGGSDYCIANGEICSMHGIQELNQNIREACVLKYNGIDSWFKFAMAMNTQCNYQNADTCWTNVASGLGLDTAKITTCETTEGEALMRADMELGNKLGVQGSPSVFIDGESYNGARSPEGFKQSLCSAFESQPSSCSTVLAGETAVTPSGGAGCAI